MRDTHGPCAGAFLPLHALSNGCIGRIVPLVILVTFVTLVILVTFVILVTLVTLLNYDPCDPLDPSSLSPSCSLLALVPFLGPCASLCPLLPLPPRSAGIEPSQLYLALSASAYWRRGKANAPSDLRFGAVRRAD